ncbi:MAG TPA: IreB family regulatory phosphoprotein [Desulfosporosinus sp.]
MDRKMEETMMFKAVVEEEDMSAHDVLLKVYAALQEKGYDPINQMVGYLMSGDPVYITSHNQARAMIRKLERFELIEELVRTYLNAK